VVDRSKSAHLDTRTALSVALKAWEVHLIDQGRSPNTVKAFLSDVRLLAQFLPADRTLGTVSTDDLNRFFTWMEKHRGVPCSPKTLARRITSAKSFFRWLHRGAVLTVDPAERVLQRTALSPLPQVLTEEEYAAVFRIADRHRRDQKPDARPYALLSLLLATGIKKSECLGIHLNHIDLDSKDAPQVFIRYASPVNRYKERKLQLPDDWPIVYREYVGQYELIDQLFPWSPRRLEYLLEEIGQESGLKKHLSFDICRWTCALRDSDAGMDADTVRQRLGVSRIQWREISMKLRELSNQNA